MVSDPTDIEYVLRELDGFRLIEARTTGVRSSGSGNNDDFVPRLRAVLEAAGRDPQCIVATLDDAMSYLRERIAARQQDPAEPHAHD